MYETPRCIGDIAIGMKFEQVVIPSYNTLAFRTHTLSLMEQIITISSKRPRGQVKFANIVVLSEVSSTNAKFVTLSSS